MQYTKNIVEQFGQKLSDEILACQTGNIPAGAQICEKDLPKGVIPIVLNGQIKVYRKDSKDNDVLIYNIDAAQSCIISIDQTFSKKQIPTFASANLDTIVALVPKEKSDIWFETYPEWRNFIVQLYGLRLEELVYQLDLSSEKSNKIKEQNEKITESIRYAKRIQEAVFPNESSMDIHGLEHFIYFKPRDIVSGDFYWIAEHEGLLFIAAADATGHGVPGAFMSMLGIAFLNELKDNADEDTQPNDFLEMLRQKVKSSLKQKGERNEAKDGMDIALCIYDPKTQMLQFSGAHNPLYIVKQKTKELIEIKSDRQPIGIHLKETPFTNHNIKLDTGDVFYLFSDGYADQFGGETGRKYKYKTFKNLLLDLVGRPMSEQKEKLNQTIENWMDNKYEQVDDILVMGIRV